MVKEELEILTKPSEVSLLGENLFLPIASLNVALPVFFLNSFIMFGSF